MSDKTAAEVALMLQQDIDRRVVEALIRVLEPRGLIAPSVDMIHQMDKESLAIAVAKLLSEAVANSSRGMPTRYTISSGEITLTRGY